MRYFLIPLSFFAIVLTACQDDQQDPTQADSNQDDFSAQGVLNCFNSYRSAILDQDGETAVKFVSSSTIDEYQRYVDWALKADKLELRGLSFINRIQVVTLRHRIDAETLRGLNGRSAIVYAVDRDWIGKNGVIQTSLGKIDIAGSRATSEVMMGDKKVPGRFQFKFEEGSWKFDLVALLQATNPAMKEAAKQAGLTEDEFLFTVLESVSGKKVDESIWTPPN